MLSYMLPVEDKIDKPPPTPPKSHLQLSLGNGGHRGSPGGQGGRNIHSGGHSGGANGHRTVLGGQNGSLTGSGGEKIAKGGLNGQLKSGGGVELVNGGQTGHQNGVGHQTKPISTPISKETSVSSFASDVTTTASGYASGNASQSSMTPTSTSERGKAKMALNGGKHQSLKRVSFGSSKGSMVETLIFESVVQEEPEPSPIPENGDTGVPSFATLGCDQTEDEREKVRVSFFQQSKPLEVDLPDETPFCCDGDFIMASPVMKNDSNHVVYNRTESTESGWDNPFRPGGDLSREADQIVELIKGGKPITPTPHLEQNDVSVTTIDGVESSMSPSKANQVNATPQKNGTTNKNSANSSSPAPGQLDVQRGMIKPEGDGATVEHVTIKKKKKSCCVLQ